MSRGERKAMSRRDHPGLGLSRQCWLLFDELFLKYPFYGSCRMVRRLWRDGFHVGRHRGLRRLMGLEAIYQAPRAGAPHPTQRIYPYLLRGTAIDRPNRIRCADITYTPVQRGFL